MAVTIVPGSARVNIGMRPSALAPAANATGQARKATFGSQPMAATGQVQLRGEPEDTPRGWVLGFVQAQWTETNWVYYRGQRNDHGSLFLQRGRPPARRSQVCLDTVNTSDVWYGEPGDRGTTTSFAVRLDANFYDSPDEQCWLVERNGLTGQDNFLHECQLGFAFCCVLVLRSPTGQNQHLAHFYWNVRWQARFRPSNYGRPNSTPWRITPNPGYRANVSRVFSGAVTDQRFAGILNVPQPTSCNLMGNAAKRHVEPGQPGRRESRSWESFDVRR
jgi:hypothetical protein